MMWADLVVVVGCLLLSGFDFYSVQYILEMAIFDGVPNLSGV